MYCVQVDCERQHLTVTGNTVCGSTTENIVVNSCSLPALGILHCFSVDEHTGPVARCTTD